VYYCVFNKKYDYIIDNEASFEKENFMLIDFCKTKACLKR
jgi:hypothetical protein